MIMIMMAMGDGDDRMVMMMMMMRKRRRGMTLPMMVVAAAVLEVHLTTPHIVQYSTYGRGKYPNGGVSPLVLSMSSRSWTAC